MCNIHNAASNGWQGFCNSPRYFISTKHGWRRYVPTGGAVPFAVKVRGKWHLVHRATSDAEFFATHPDAAHRLTVRQLAPKPWAVRVRVAERSGEDILADNFDFAVEAYRADGGTRGERWEATICRMLRNPNLNILAA